MMQRNKGHIVAISSIAGLVGNAGITDYSTSKFAAYGFNEAMRIEMKQLKKSIRFTTIAPYYTNTGLFEGVKTGKIFPLLEPKTVVDRTILAILQEEDEVSIPWTMGTAIHLIKGFFPSSIVD